MIGDDHTPSYRKRKQQGGLQNISSFFLRAPCSCPVVVAVSPFVVSSFSSFSCFSPSFLLLLLLLENGHVVGLAKLLQLSDLVFQASNLGRVQCASVRRL